jgi:hypothetical protein
MEPAFISPWLAGVLTALVAVAYAGVTGWMLGVSGLFDAALRRRVSNEDLLAALEAATLAQFGEQPGAGAAEGPATAPSDRNARRWFLPGMLLGGLAWRLLSPATGLEWGTLGPSMSLWLPSLGARVGVLFGSGVLLGFGARMAGGCTSGHGLSGVATGQRGSFVSVAVFWTVATALSAVMNRVAGR